MFGRPVGRVGASRRAGPMGREWGGRLRRAASSVAVEGNGGIPEAVVEHSNE